MEPMVSGESGRIGRLAGRVLCAVVLAALALLGAAPLTAAASPECKGRAMYVVAHEDDSLLFQSPDLLEDIRDGRCVRTVFLTAGDNGEEESYWITREEGAEAAYAQMAGLVPSAAWTPSTETVRGAVDHPIRFETLAADSRISLVFLRLPDGGYPAGEGTPLYGMQSLMKLWNGGNAALPAESSVEAVDGSTSYEYEDLTATLAALMASFEPQWIATQNYTGSFGNGDHPDHVATAKFTEEAQALYALPHELTGYEDYEISLLDENVAGELLEAKEEAFDAYNAHDGACTEGESCVSLYEKWLKRQYVAASEAIGDPTPTADAGSDRSVVAGETVILDGSASASPYRNQPLEYEWAQTGGPAVTLTGAETANPSFTAPAAPASLTFELVVADPLATSAPSTANVTVTEPEEPPKPPVEEPSGPPATVAPSATVGSDGGSTVDLRLSRRRVRLIAGRRTRQAVFALGRPYARLWCRGRLPRGARCRVVGNRRIVLEGTRRLRRTGVYRLTVHAVDGEGRIGRAVLTVGLRDPERRKRHTRHRRRRHGQPSGERRRRAS